MMTETRPTLTLPAFMAGERLTVFAPPEVYDRLRALSPRLLYGPGFSRAILDELVSMSYAFRDGYNDLALSYLAAAGARAGTAPQEWAEAYDAAEREAAEEVSP